MAYISPVPFFGNMASVVFRRQYMGDHMIDVYNHFSHLKYFGYYNLTGQVIAIRDPELVTSVAVKNFDNFTDHFTLLDVKSDPVLAMNLFGLRGNHWREMRKVLSPAFTCSKMKLMSQLIIDCASKFTDYVAERSNTGHEYDLREIFHRYTVDVVATCNYGIAVDSLREPNNEFYMNGQHVSLQSTTAALILVIGNQFPVLMKLLGLKLFSDKVVNYFTSLVKEMIQTRDEKGIYRPDMLQLMMDLKDKDGKRLPIEEITGQVFIFFLGGFDTSSLLMCFAAHEIGCNPEVQEKLLAEIDEVNRKTNGKPNYDAFSGMRYMDAVLDETSRMYMGAPFLDRECVKKFELPPAGPGLKPVTVKPGDVVWFLSGAIHKDPKYYPDPYTFKPERFLNGEVSPYNFLPFGIGPRNCIGKRFGQMQTKILLFYLLQQCKLEPSSKTMMPIEFDTAGVLQLPKNGFWMNIKARNGYSPANSDVGKAENGKIST
ncbi:Cytochrome P450 9e2 [Dufourea novaeangliae]|uniref:Cytochrome P450 9e2 n=1 Tax=Dufourea novaeangliae TaxID=178035 RepID=A0A154NW23_DUFNO|nr:Cytochrome P450 9e2 [Dufourea novaeangliae]